MSAPTTLASLTIVELKRSKPRDQGQYGRLYMPNAIRSKVDTTDLQHAFDEQFSDDDDDDRLEKLKVAISRPTITVATYPGYGLPQALHAYVETPAGLPIFGCVLMSLATVKHTLERPPHVLMETASLQVVGPTLSDVSIAAAIEYWIARVWPAEDVPRVLLSPWPGAVESEEALLDLHQLLVEELALQVKTNTEETFFPPVDLVPDEYKMPEEAA